MPQRFMRTLHAGCWMLLLAAAPAAAQLTDNLGALTGANAKGYLGPLPKALSGTLNSAIFTSGNVPKAAVNFTVGIKLMGVPGRKMLDTQADAPTHDFILISAPNFPSRTPGEFDALVAAVIGNLWHKLSYFVTHPRVAWMLLSTMVKHANVLQIPYFSAVPYAFGDPAATPSARLAVKYVALPRVAQPDSVPIDPPGNSLRDAAARQLARGEAVFDFCVQFQRDEDSMPIEDPSRAWSLALSPPRRVASLRILQQTFDTPEIDARGENLSYTPWHCLAEHQPLGEINHARRLIYETLSELRHERNHVPRTEPSDWQV